MEPYRAVWRPFSRLRNLWMRYRYRWGWRGGHDGDKLLKRMDIPTYREWFAKNGEGERAHWSNCYLCRDSYLWKSQHYIGITHCFPYCQECHETEGIHAKIGAMVTLVKSWYLTAPDLLWTYNGFGGYVRVFLLSVLGILLGQ